MCLHLPLQTANLCSLPEAEKGERELLIQEFTCTYVHFQRGKVTFGLPQWSSFVQPSTHLYQGLTFYFVSAEFKGRLWYVTMDGQHNHPHHLGDQNSPLCKVAGPEYQHDAQVCSCFSFSCVSALKMLTDTCIIKF